MTSGGRGKVLACSFLLILALLVGQQVFFVIAFIGGNRSMLTRGDNMRAARRSFADDYPNLARIEKHHNAICDLNPESPFPAAHSNFVKLITKNTRECKVDLDNCAMLDIMERICKNIESDTVGITTLWRITGALHDFRMKFTNWDKAFDAVDTDGSSDISISEFVCALKKYGANLTEEDIVIAFAGADANSDGVICRGEFKQFFSAALVAEHAMEDTLPGALPRTPIIDLHTPMVSIPVPVLPRRQKQTFALR